MATSGGDIGNKYRQLPWYGSNEKRESYEKPMREAKTIAGSPDGGGDSVGLAEAMKIRPWISSFQEREFL